MVAIGTINHAAKAALLNGVRVMNVKNNWNTYRTRFLVRARQLTQPLVFTDSLGREHSGQPGDYLVETSDGIRRITTRALFEDIYVPLSPVSIAPPGECVQKRPTSAVLDRSGPSPSAGERVRATTWTAGKLLQ